MLRDISAVVWKEIRELFFAPGNSVRGRILVFIALVGIVVPLQQGLGWLTSPLAVLLVVMDPVFLVLNVIADTFAGERERHTLETLLASRLSDRSILFGKLITAILYGWGISLALLVVGLIVVNVTRFSGAFHFYSGEVLLGCLLLGLLMVTFMSALGILISLKAPSVRQAQQTLSISFLVIFLGLIYGVQALPRDWTANLLKFAGDISVYGVILILAGVLLVLDFILVNVTLAQFKRSRLMLS
ncbi:MAG TPA: ABC transporter permease [Chloroflexia bacterium]|nr:ABC transporter permease [Chloroflexia bacterium]